MRYTILKQPTYLTDLDPKYTQMIFKAKLEMFDTKINFKGLYPANLLCPFLEHLQIYCVPFLEHLHNITDLQRLIYVRKLLVKYE